MCRAESVYTINVCIDYILAIVYTPDELQCMYIRVDMIWLF